MDALRNACLAPSAIWTLSRASTSAMPLTVASICAGHMGRPPALATSSSSDASRHPSTTSSTAASMQGLDSSTMRRSSPAWDWASSAASVTVRGDLPQPSAMARARWSSIRASISR